jgi:hypothetical protein
MAGTQPADRNNNTGITQSHAGEDETSYRNPEGNRREKAAPNHNGAGK